MPSTFEKLQLKDQKEIVVLNAPRSFEPELARLKNVAVLRSPDAARDIEFWLAFVSTEKEVDALARTIPKRSKGDTVVWFAYPKASSKKYHCDITRDAGWQALGKVGFEAVRMVAIDDDWSAKRYRRVEYIKTMRRPQEHAMTVEGKARLAKK